MNPDKLPEISLQTDGVTIKVAGGVIGEKTSDGTIRYLTFEQQFRVPSFDPADSSVTGSGGGDWVYPGDSTIAACADKTKIENKKCKSTVTPSRISEIDDSTVYFPYEFSTLNRQKLDIEDSKVYFKGSMTVGGNELEIEDSIVTSEGSVSVTKDIDIEDSHFYVKGSVTSDKDIETEDSIVNIGSNLYAKKELEIEDSTVKIGGYLKADEDIEIEDSTVEVAGELIAGKEFELEDSKMIVRGSAALRGNTEIEDSYLYIGGALHSSGNKLEVKDKSKVCVAGSLQIDNKPEISSSSYIYYKGAFAYYGGGTPSSRIQCCQTPIFQRSVL